MQNMIKSVKRQILKWLYSKKGNAFICGMLTLYLQEKLQWPPNMVIAFVGLVSAYLLAQGAADHGKEKARADLEKAKVEARANTLNTTVVNVTAGRKANRRKKKPKKKAKKAKSKK